MQEECVFRMNRGSPGGVLKKKVSGEILQNSQETPAMASLFREVVGLGLQKCFFFSEKFAKFFKTLFTENTSG